MPTKLTTEGFIAKARAVHGDRYGYERAEYKLTKIPIELICREHGGFKQKAQRHLQGRGCPKCGDSQRGVAQRMGIDCFLSRAVKVHGKAYNYLETIYKTNKTPINIKCPIHGIFNQRPDDHLRGQGCPLCGDVKAGDKRRATQLQFIAKAKEKHGNRYDYSNCIYSGNKNVVEIICPQHGPFRQVALNHVVGRGCPACANESRAGWSRSGWANIQKGRQAILYVIELRSKDECFYKVGITLQSVSRRFNKLKEYTWQTIALFKSLNAEQVFDLERKIVYTLKHISYKPKVSFQGQTECFSCLPPLLSLLPPETCFTKQLALV